MKTENNRAKRMAILGLILSFSLTIGWAQKTIDMTEEFLKIAEPAMFHDLGAKGFAVFDKGAGKLKFFDWNFKLVNQFPLKSGEGPGELKNFISAVYIVQDKIYLNSFFDKKIMVFDQKGAYVNQFPLDFIPRKIVQRKNRLYLFKLNIDPNQDTLSLGIIIDLTTGKKTKDIQVKEKLFDLKAFDGMAIMIGLSSRFDVDENGNVNLLNGGANLFVKIGQDNKIIQKIELPYKERKISGTTSNGEKYISDLDTYEDMRAFKDGVYICFLKTVKDDKENRIKIYQTTVLKILKSGKILEKAIDGNLVIIGQKQDKLFLFETEDYKIIPVKLTEW